MRSDRRSLLAGAVVAFACAAIGGCHSLLGPPPLDENWRLHPGPRVSFYVRPDSFAEQNVARLSELMEDQYSATVRQLGLTYAGQMRAYVYNSGGDADFESDHAGTAYPETESFRFVAIPPVNENLFGLMAHEGNHVLIIAGLGEARTHGMTEGLASAVISETFYNSGRHFYFSWARTHRSEVLPLARVFDNGEWAHLPPQRAYNTSASFLAWLLDTYGLDRLRRLYDATSSEFQDRVNAIYGRPLDALEQDWLRFCDAFPG